MIANLADLKTALTAYGHRDDGIPFYDLFVDSCERKINHYVRIKEMEVRMETETSEGFVSLPTDLLEIKRVTVNDAEITFSETPQKIQILPKNLNRNFNTDSSSQQSSNRFTTKYRYSIGFDNIEIEPKPPEDPDTQEIIPHNVKMVYYAKVAPLIADSQTNPVLTLEPFVYLYGCMHEFMLFTEDLEKAAVWEQNFMQEAARLKDIYDKLMWTSSMAREFY